MSEGLTAEQEAVRRLRGRDYTVNLLEAEAHQFRTIITRERAENAKLREALTKACSWLDRIIDKYDPDDSEGGRADVEAWRAIATSTTEAVTE